MPGPEGKGCLVSRQMSAISVRAALPAALLRFARLPSAVKKLASMPTCLAAWSMKPWNCHDIPPPVLLTVAPNRSPWVSRLAHSSQSCHVAGALVGSAPPSRTAPSFQIRW